MISSDKSLSFRLNRPMFAELQGQVLEPVKAAAASGEWRYFRGLHLGAVALNYFRGLPVLNVHGDPSMHFSDSYEYARGIANSQCHPAARLRHQRQFTAEDAAQLSDYWGEDVSNIAFPSMVVALHASQEPFLYPADMEGMVFDGYLTPADLDPHSQAMLGQLLNA